MTRCGVYSCVKHLAISISDTNPTNIDPKHCLKNVFFWVEHIVSTQWGPVKHMCVSKLTIIRPDNGLSPCRRQASIWISVGLEILFTVVQWQIVQFPRLRPGFDPRISRPTYQGTTDTGVPAGVKETGCSPCDDPVAMGSCGVSGNCGINVVEVFIQAQCKTTRVPWFPQGSLWDIQNSQFITPPSWSCKSQGRYGLHSTWLPPTLNNHFGTYSNKLEWNLQRNSYIFIQENAFEYVVCEMAVILSGLPCFKQWKRTL